MYAWSLFAGSARFASAKNLLCSSSFSPGFPEDIPEPKTFCLNLNRMEPRWKRSANDFCQRGLNMSFINFVLTKLNTHNDSCLANLHGHIKTTYFKNLFYSF